MAPPELKLKEGLGDNLFHSLYRAQDLDGKSVLLKTTRQGSGKLAIERVCREFEVLRHLQIADLVRPIRLTESGGQTAIVMEDPGGRPLSRILQEGPFVLKLALQVAAKLAGALAGLHHAGYTHQDIQPFNIMVDVQTGETRLHGLGTASQVPHTVQGGRGARILGTPPAYMSPEFSGRTHCIVDYRTDFYSLGVTLFEMLTGELPFKSEDPLELIHAHVAKRPTAPSQINPKVPRCVSEIVLKLLAKSAEERYQGGRGLRHDLERCLAELDAKGRIDYFDLARLDPPTRFELPQRFYGREAEMEVLRKQLEEAAGGTVRAVVVTGAPGVGKTSLVCELQDLIYSRKGCFVSGKYDALERETPYVAIREAFQKLWRRLLTEKPEQVDVYRKELAEALGPNLGVIVEVSPELATIVGTVPPVPDLGPVESKNRFHLCFQKALRVLATQDHPLVLFLDNLQWADPSSLELMEGMLDRGLGHFLLLGAFRDTEKSGNHELIQVLERIRDKGIPVETLTLGPLDFQDIRRLVADSLRTEVETAAPLADLVFQKTAGNAFFAKAFLTSINTERLLEPNLEGAWTWDAPRISALQTTENVLDPATRKIEQMPDRIRRTITLASVLGNTIDARDLAAVLESPVEEVESDLIEACRKRILLKSGNRYQFEHHRLQENAYALIPATERPEMHLRVGRFLANLCDDASASSQVFNILDHLNRVTELIEDPLERERTARLNLSAGRMAKAEAAFSAAHHFFLRGLSLLPDNGWEKTYELTLALYTEAAESAFLTGDFRETDRLSHVMLANARTLLDKIPAYEARIAIAHARLSDVEVFRIILEVVKLLGVDVTGEPGPDEINEAVLNTQRAVMAALSQPPAQALPENNAESLAAMQLLTRAAVAAVIVNHPLYLSIACKLFDLAIRNGHCPEAPVAYVMTGGILCCLLDDYQNGCRAGERGMALLERSPSPRWQAFCHFLFTMHVYSWRLHYEELVDGFSEAHRIGLETGEFLIAVTSAYFFCETALHAGMELCRLETSIRKYHEEASQIGVERICSGLLRLEQTVSVLKDGGAISTLHPQSSLATEDAWQAWHRSADQTVQEITLCHEMMVLCLYRQLNPALEAALALHDLPAGSAVSALLPTDFYICLSLLDALGHVAGEAAEKYMQVVTARLERLRFKARACPPNHRHKLDLVEAQRLRILGDSENAAALFDKAIDGARQNRYVHEEALFNEIAAEFCLELGREPIAVVYIRAAVSAYERWGASGKVDQLGKKYAEYLSHADETSNAVIQKSLDTLSIERAAVALSQELDLERLLDKLMRILLQDAGAQRGFLLQEERGQIHIEAYASVDEESVSVLQKIPIETWEGLSCNIVRYVNRSRETVVIGDATQDWRFAGTPYIEREKPKSILCTPVLHRGKPVALLYLENNRIRDAFDRDRIEAIQVISSQAAVALENARLHDGLKKEVSTRRQTEKELRLVLDEVAGLKDRLQAENVYLREEITHDFEEIVGKSEALRKVLHQVVQVASTDAGVLILGETGTGKELLARAIHSRSLRRDRALVRINCATLPATLIESELFGHEKGAFTGAISKKAGRFEAADGGTIFLDEIGELPLELQSKLLRVLQDGEFERLGSSATYKVDVRVLAATNRDLKSDADSGRFRRDLFYRLSVFPIELPPLRDRRNDIPLLVWYFITRKQAELRKNISKIPKETMETLMDYPWPGNVRELQNVIERAIILSNGPTLTLDDSWGVKQTQRVLREPADEQHKLDEMERRHIMQVLELCRWRVKGKGNAAERLGLHPSTLSFRMKKLGIERPQGPHKYYTNQLERV